MKVKFRQSSIGWCSVYVLANMFDNKKILNEVGNVIYEGCTEIEINEILLKYESNVQIDKVIYANQSYPRIPVDYLFNCLSAIDDGLDMSIMPVTPYLLSVRRIESVWHQVAVFNANGNLYYLDPYNENYIKIENIEHLSTLFIDCYCVERISLIDTKQWAVLWGKGLGFEDFFNENES